MHNLDVHKDGIYKGFTASYPELYESYQGTPMNVTGMGQEGPWLGISPGFVQPEDPSFDEGLYTVTSPYEEIVGKPLDETAVWTATPPTRTVSDSLLGTRNFLTTLLHEGTSVAKVIIQGQYAAQAAEDRLELQKIQYEQAAKIRELQMAGRVASGRTPGEMPTWAVPVAVGVLGVLLLARLL